MTRRCVKIGVGGPVGSGKTALLDTLCKRMRDRYQMAVITNDIYTREDAEFLTRSGALSPDRIMGVEEYRDLGQVDRPSRRPPQQRYALASRSWRLCRRHCQILLKSTGAIAPRESKRGPCTR